MSRYLPLLLLGVFLFSGCAFKEVSRTQAPPVRSFDQEETYIIHGLYYKQHRQFDKAYAVFEELYKKTGKLEYKIEALRLLIAAKKYDRAEEELARLIPRYPDHAELYKLQTLTLLQLKKIDQALESAKQVYRLEPDSLQAAGLLASIYLAKGLDQEAYRVYADYYEKSHDDTAVVKMASILFHKMKNSEEAIRLLETHSKMVGCSENVCLFLAELYRQKNDLEHLADVYARMYQATKSPEYAQKAAEIYAYKKEYKKAEKLLETSHADDRLLLAIYKHTRSFSKAAQLARHLYEETMDPVWLAEYGVLLYESAPKKEDPKLLKEVVATLSQAFKEGVNDPLYYNYLGYLLIDHDLDVKWGIELVKKALEAEPDSAFYIDSLAWGYYKLGRCEEAYRQMKKAVAKLGLKDKEIVTHWNEIKACRSRKK